MKRVYYVQDKDDSYYYLRTASYGFSDEEEVKSATNDILCETSNNLVLNKYVVFIDEVIRNIDDKLIVSGSFCLMENEISDLDKEEYDKEFDLSVKAFKENDENGINRWNKYLESYENKFMNFKPLETYKELFEGISK